MTLILTCIFGLVVLAYGMSNENKPLISIKVVNQTIVNSTVNQQRE